MPIDPVVCGKPSPAFFATLRKHVAGRVLLIGDTVAADVALAVAAGWDGLLGLTGTSADQSADWQRATFVAPDLEAVGASDRALVQGHHQAEPARSGRVTTGCRPDMTATAETGRQSAAGKESAEMSTAATSAGPEADDAAALGAPIRELRKGAGLTLESVADAAQISASLLSRVERRGAALAAHTAHLRSRPRRADRGALRG